MVRTKAGSVSTKAVGAKAPQKVAITAILSGNASKSRNHSGGNSYHPRETPGWQKPITFFMKQDAQSSKDLSKDNEDRHAENQTTSEKTAKKSATKRSSRNHSDMEVEEPEEVEIKEKKMKKEETGEAKTEKKDESYKLKDDWKKQQEEEEDEGIPGISASESNKKTLETNDDMVEVEEAEKPATQKKTMKKDKTDESKELEKEKKDDNKENELKKDDTAKK